MADFDVFGSQDGGDFQVSGSNEWFANIVQVGSVFSFDSAASIKRTAPFSAASRISLTSSASFKKTAYFSASSAIDFSNSAVIQRKAKAVSIALIYTAPVIKVVA